MIGYQIINAVQTKVYRSPEGYEGKFALSPGFIAANQVSESSHRDVKPVL